MTGKEHYPDGKKKLLDFCKKHQRIYVYGAGIIGKKCFEVLQQTGTVVSGFITTTVVAKEYCKIPVYTVDEASLFITEADGVIPAYREADSYEILNRFLYLKPDVLCNDVGVIACMKNESYLLPIVEEISNQFPTKKLPRAKRGWKNLMVIRLDAIGDIICTTAFIRELKRNYSGAELTVVVRKQNVPLLKNCPYIDNLLPYESPLSDVSLFEECADVERIKEKVSLFIDELLYGRHFDAVFLPRDILGGRNRMEEFLMAFYSGADYRIGHLIGYGSHFSWIYAMVEKAFSHISYQTRAMHEAEYQLEMLREWGLEVEDERLELWPDSESRELAEKVFRKNGVIEEDKLIAVGLVGSVLVKTWSAENYKELIRLFHKKYGEEYKFVLFGGDDAIKAAEILTEDTEIIINLTGRLDIEVTVACMEHCCLYVGSNTGLLHIATALEKPSVTLYMVLDDATDECGAGPCRWGARRQDSISLLPPAGLDGCHISCQKATSHCINQITPHQVAEAMERILNL